MDQIKINLHKNQLTYLQLLLESYTGASDITFQRVREC